MNGSLVSDCIFHSTHKIQYAGIWSATILSKQKTSLQNEWKVYSTSALVNTSALVQKANALIDCVFLSVYKTWIYCKLNSNRPYKMNENYIVNFPLQIDSSHLHK
jgi:hypothetical protein